MAKIRLSKRHGDDKAAARAKVEKAIQDPVTKFGLSKQWVGDTLKVSGKGMNGSLTVGDTSVDIDMDLGLPASMVSSKIEAQLKAELDKAFG